MSDDFTMNELRNKDADDYASPKDRDRDEGKVMFLKQISKF